MPTEKKSKPEPLPHADAAINKSLTSQEKIHFLQQMMRIRRFEQNALRQYQTSGQMGGFLHLYTGQESLAVGAVSLCGEHDQIITTYRDHGHALAVGMSMEECMAELYGRADGCSKGKGGSMHFFAPDKNFWGGHGIVGGHTPLALGIAFAQKYKGITDGSCLCFLGDGAVNQGPYHESLNLASLWDIPVIYIIENNDYSMGTSLQRSSAFRENLAKRAEGYDIEWDIGEGENIYEVRAKLKKAIDRAHNESRPTVLELDTYRYYGHSVADANSKKYRSPEEIEEHKKKHDPILLWQKQLILEGIITEEDAKKMDKDAQAEAKKSVEFAANAPLPRPEAILEDVYYEVDNDTEAAAHGRYFFNNDWK